MRPPRPPRKAEAVTRAVSGGGAVQEQGAPSGVNAGRDDAGVGGRPALKYHRNKPSPYEWSCAPRGYCNLEEGGCPVSKSNPPVCPKRTCQAKAANYQVRMPTVSFCGGPLSHREGEGGREGWQKGERARRGREGRAGFREGREGRRGAGRRESRGEGREGGSEGGYGGREGGGGEKGGGDLGWWCGARMRMYGACCLLRVAICTAVARMSLARRMALYVSVLDSGRAP